MTKTLVLFFIFGLMVSCASYRGDRSISSVERDRHHEQEYRADLIGRK